MIFLRVIKRYLATKVHIIFIFCFQGELNKERKLVVIEVREGLGMCSEYPLETEAALMVSLTSVLCTVVFAGIPLLLTAVSACKRVARKTGVEA